MCRQCQEWHERALLLIGGEPPPGCQECGLTFEQVAQLARNVNVRFEAVPKDGIYAVLCGTCADLYTPKRRDLVKGTEAGELLR